LFYLVVQVCPAKGPVLQFKSSHMGAGGGGDNRAALEPEMNSPGNNPLIKPGAFEPPRMEKNPARRGAAEHQRERP